MPPSDEWVSPALPPALGVPVVPVPVELVVPLLVTVLEQPNTSRLRAAIPEYFITDSRLSSRPKVLISVPVAESK